MSIQNVKNIRSMLYAWPIHAVVPIFLLVKKGYSRSLIQRAVSSKWIEPIGRGAVIKYDDKAEWSGFVWGLQQTQKAHIGGKTALEILGKAHFIKFNDTEIYLFSKKNYRLPSWMKSNSLKIEFLNITTNLFSDNFGIEKISFGEFFLDVSNPARAFCEYIYLLDKYHSYDEAYYLMENLQFLTPHLMQEALENCSSVKVKRLVLCLAKIQGAEWYKKINLSKINLGIGKRQAVKNGIYDTEYKISYPRSWKGEVSEDIF